MIVHRNITDLVVQTDMNLFHHGITA